MKILTDKWEDEPRELTDAAKAVILVLVAVAVLLGALKIGSCMDNIEQQHTEMQYGREWGR